MPDGSNPITPTPLKIESDVPMPLPKNGVDPTITGAFRQLAGAAIGASFFIPCKPRDDMAKFYPMARRVGGKGWITCRRVEGGFRVWKLTEPQPA